MTIPDNVTIVGKCACGAITISVEGNEYSMRPKTFQKLFGVPRAPRVKVRWHSCNHCVNHWGVDLCACGSGDAPDKCTNRMSMCGRPYQNLPGTS